MEAITSFIVTNWVLILAACLALVVIIISICLGRLNTKAQRVDRKIRKCNAICNDIAAGNDVSASQLAKCKKQLEEIVADKKVNSAIKSQAAAVLSQYFSVLPEDSKMLTGHSAAQLACGKSISNDEVKTLTQISEAQMEMDGAIVALRNDMKNIDAEVEARKQDLIAEYTALSSDAKLNDTLWQITNCTNRKEKAKVIAEFKKACGCKSHLKACLKQIDRIEKDGIRIKKQLYKNALDRQKEIANSLDKSVDEWPGDPVSKKKILGVYWKNKAASLMNPNAASDFVADDNKGSFCNGGNSGNGGLKIGTKELPFKYPGKFIEQNSYLNTLAAAYSANNKKKAK